MYSAMLLLTQVINAKSDTAVDSNEYWEAGSAAIDITPEGPLWMAGYASRVGPATEMIHSLWAKALVLRDHEGKTGVMISSDLVGIPRNISNIIRDSLRHHFDLTSDQVLINSSHTHTGPYLYDPFRPYTATLPDLDLERVKKYSEDLVGKILTVVSEAMNKMELSEVYSGAGTARFQVNRRNNVESTLSPMMALNGPNDFSVPVLKVTDLEGKVKCILLSYACHATVLNGRKWSGDYPGFAQIDLEKTYPGATVLFFQGCAGDLNPLPRRTESLALQYGKTLAAAVEEVVGQDMERLSSTLVTSYQEIDLRLSDPPTLEDLVAFKAQNSNIYFEIWVDRMIAQLDSGEPLIRTYPFPVQLWSMGEQRIVALGGEPVVEYSIRIKELLGRETFVFGYSNDGNCAYIPNARILSEGGYEGRTSQYHKGFPSPWDPSIELNILSAVIRLSEDKNLPIIQRSLTR